VIFYQRASQNGEIMDGHVDSLSIYVEDRPRAGRDSRKSGGGTERRGPRAVDRAAVVSLYWGNAATERSVDAWIARQGGRRGLVGKALALFLASGYVHRGEKENGKPDRRVTTPPNCDGIYVMKVEYRGRLNNLDHGYMNVSS
jgi:hypothetical protein